MHNFNLKCGLRKRASPVITGKSKTNPCDSPPGVLTSHDSDKKNPDELSACGGSPAVAVNLRVRHRLGGNMVPIENRTVFYSAFLAVIIAFLIPMLSYYLSYNDNVEKLQIDCENSGERFHIETQRLIEVLGVYNEQIAMEKDDPKIRQLQKEKGIFSKSHLPLVNFDGNRICHDLQKEIELKISIKYYFASGLSAIIVAIVWCLYRLSGRQIRPPRWFQL